MNFRPARAVQGRKATGTPTGGQSAFPLAGRPGARERKNPLNERVDVGWWRGEDSNLRSRSTTDLQSVPFGHSGTPPKVFCDQLPAMLFPAAVLKAGERNRTPDRLITNQLLYQLSYAGV